MELSLVLQYPQSCLSRPPYFSSSLPTDPPPIPSIRLSIRHSLYFHPHTDLLCIWTLLSNMVNNGIMFDRSTRTVGHQVTVDNSVVDAQRFSPFPELDSLQSWHFYLAKRRGRKKISNRLEASAGMSPTGSASGDSVPASVQEQVANVLEELQILGNLEKLVAASEVSRLNSDAIGIDYVRKWNRLSIKRAWDAIIQQLLPIYYNSIFASGLRWEAGIFWPNSDTLSGSMESKRASRIRWSCHVVAKT